MLEVEDVCLCFFPASMLGKYDGHLNHFCLKGSSAYK